MRTIERVVRRAWWRLVLGDWLRTSAVLLSVAAAMLLGWRLASSVIWSPSAWGVLMAIGAGAAIFAALVISVARVQRGEAVARRVDDRAGLNEALSTALSVSSAEDAWSRAAVAQAERTAADVDLGRAMPVAAPRGWPVPVAAWGVLAVAVALPVPDLSAWFAPEPVIDGGQQAVVQARADVDDATARLKDEAERLGLDLGLDDADAEGDADTAADQSAEEIRAAAVKKLTKLGDELAEQMAGSEQRAREALEKNLQRLRQPGPGPAEDLARALARGEFADAQDALAELRKKLEEGSMTDGERQQLESQLRSLSEQLEELSERRGELEQALREAGLSAEDAARLAGDPDALREALDSMEGLSDAQRQQLQQMADAQQQASDSATGMSNATSQMADAVSAAGQPSGQSGGQPGNSQMMAGAMGELGDQLSAMEMLSQDMASMQAMMQQVQAQQGQLGGSLASSSMRGSDRWGRGGRQPGSASGVDTESEDSGQRFSSSAAKAPMKDQNGPIIGSTLVYESQVRGESRAAFAAAAESASASASDAIESMRVPRAYESAVQRYFGALEREAASDSDDSADSGGADDADQ
ncbi:MAG: hypothetical protein AAFR96_02825 [Planctomycetota bacterium]